MNSARVFRYPGGNLGTGNPVEVTSAGASSTVVKRGEAFWVRGSTNYYNRYYGPVEVALQNATGIHYGETLGTYSVRLKNLTTAARTVTFNLTDSESVPTGQTNIIAKPQLLVRGALSATTLTYPHTVLAGQSFTLAAQGEVGSEQEVVLGLNRSTMTVTAGSLYAGILRITDATGLQQIDVPVTAAVPNASGLWVGQAVVDQVGQYIKQYSRVNAAEPAPRASFLTLDGSTAGAASLPTTGVPFDAANFTVESWVYLRQATANAKLFDFEVAGQRVALNLTGQNGDARPNFLTASLYNSTVRTNLRVTTFTTSPVDANFNGTPSRDGLVISFEFELDGSGAGDWVGISLGVPSSDKGMSVSAPKPHEGFAFRRDGKTTIWNSGVNPSVSEAAETRWSSSTRANGHIDIVCSDPSDGNPFDGVGSTRIDVFSLSSSTPETPIYSTTKTGGGYADNYINFSRNNGSGANTALTKLVVAGGSVARPASATPSGLLAGQTNSALIISGVETNDAGRYFVVVTNAWGSVTSHVATLSVYIPPQLTQSPADHVTVFGSNVSFTLAVGGTQPLNIQWYWQPGVARAAVAVPDVRKGFVVGATILHGGGYYLSAPNVQIVDGSGGGAIATAVVNNGAVTAVNITAPGSGYSTNAAMVIDPPVPGFPQPLNGQTNATLNLPTVRALDTGRYFAIVSNGGGSVTSASAVLKVQVPLIFVLPPQRLGNGAIRVLFGNLDGSQLVTADLATIEIWGSTNVGDPNAWVRITNGVSLQNGQVQVDDPDSSGLPSRFYRVLIR